MISVLLWWFIITLFGVVGWFSAYNLFRFLPDRGYALIRPLGLLIVGYILWLGGSFRLLQNNIGGIIIAIILAIILGIVWQRSSSDATSKWAWLHQNMAYVLSVEILFHVAFISWTIFKAYNPNIETAGGEKWMEIAFINGTLRSDYFPPKDPWLSGFGISYYYFGYVMMAMTTRLTGIISTTAFNLYIPTLFAMTLTAAFGILSNMVTLHKRQKYGDLEPLAQPVTILTGLAGAVFVGILSNLQGVFEVFHKRGLFSPEFWIWLDIRDLKVPPAGPSDSWIPDRFIWWWRASRVLTDYNLSGGEQEVIDEFPFFSFLLGDVHPHVLALPFVLLVTALALNLLANPTRREQGLPAAGLFERLQLTLSDGWRDLSAATGGRLALIIYIIAVGGLSFLNTWDFPIYLGVLGLTLILWLTYQKPNLSEAIQSGFIGTVILAILGVVFYFPFYATFQSQAGGILPNLWNPTRLPHYLVFFGPFIVANLGLLIAFTGRFQNWPKQLINTLLITIVGPVFVMLLVFSSMLLSENGQQFINGILNNPAVREMIGGASISALTQEVLQRRLSTPLTFLLVGGMSGWALAYLIGERQQGTANESENAPPAYRLLTENFALVLLVAGLGLTLVVEFAYLRDNFGTRMNTVFKFYFQAWVLLALASAYAVYYVSTLRGILVTIWQGLMAVLVLGGLIYPTLSILNKTNNFTNEPTLNGIHWVSQHRPNDYAAIQWLRKNANDTDVVLEAPGAGYAAYQYTGRVSALTGLPTLLGWGGHQSQWRGNYDEPGRREPDIETLYNTTDLNQMHRLLDKYDVTYVYVGPLEQERYAPSGLAKFGITLDTVYEHDGVTIYQRK